MATAELTPAERVDDACGRWGEADVVAGCARLLTGGTGAPTGPDAELAMVLGGLADRTWLAGGKAPGHAYWARVWAARALTHVWAERATPAVVAALADEQWRVREMAARVIGLRELGVAADELVARLVDDVPRVRAAAATALGAVGEGEHAAALRALVDDEQPDVARRARLAVEAMSERLDRPV